MHHCDENFIVTARSFLDLVKHVFTIPGVTSFLSNKICQDPLEKFFGCQRQRGGASSHPNVADFTHNTQALRVVNTFCRAPTRGNCRLDDNEEATEKGGELPKRRTQRSK
jgi:hypothetical protein